MALLGLHHIIIIWHLSHMISTHLYYKHVRNKCILIFQFFFFEKIWTFKTYLSIKIFKHDERNNNTKENWSNNDYKSKILNIINYMGISWICCKGYNFLSMCVIK
jgi:hypothetical protein